MTQPTTHIISPTPATSGSAAEVASAAEPQLREVFDSFVGEVFYGQMLEAMRKTVGKPTYFHGGQAEEIFRGQLDQVLSQRMAKTDAGGLTDSMFELFSLRRN